MSALVILNAVQPVNDEQEQPKTRNFCGQKKEVQDYQCWLTTSHRGDVFSCALHMCNRSDRDRIYAIRGLDILQDLDRMRSREFENKIELKSCEETEIVLFNERVVSDWCPVSLVLNIFDQTPRATFCFDFSNAKLSGANVCLIVGDTKMHVHKELLMFCSPVFGAMFSCYFAEGKENDVVLKNIDPECFLTYLNIIYNNDRRIDDTSYIYLLDLADQFDTDCVRRLCEDYLILKLPYLQDHLAILKLCHRYGLGRLMILLSSGSVKNLNTIGTNEQKLINKFLDSNLRLDNKSRIRQNHRKFPHASEYSIDLTRSLPNHANEVVFLINGARVYGDKKVVSLFSPVLRKMLESTKESEISIELVPYDHFYHLLSLLSNSVRQKDRLNDICVIPMLRLAERFQIRFLKEECRSFLMSYDGYFIKYNEILELAVANNFEDVKESTLLRIAQVTTLLRELLTKNCFDNMPLSSFAIEESYGFLKKWCL